MHTKINQLLFYVKPLLKPYMVNGILLLSKQTPWQQSGDCGNYAVKSLKPYLQTMPMALVTLKTNTMATVGWGRLKYNYMSGPNMPEDVPIMLIPDAPNYTPPQIFPTIYIPKNAFAKCSNSRVSVYFTQEWRCIGNKNWIRLNLQRAWRTMWPFPPPHLTPSHTHTCTEPSILKDSFTKRSKSMRISVHFTLPG